jgi:hypothetical protein
MYEIYVQKKIDMGLRAAESGRLVPHDEAKRRLVRKQLFSGPSQVSTGKSAESAADPL